MDELQTSDELTFIPESIEPICLDVIEAILKDKNFCEAYFRLAQVYRELKDYKKAIQLLAIGTNATADLKKKKIFAFELGEVLVEGGGPVGVFVVHG